MQYHLFRSLILQRQKVALALALIVPQALVFGGVNPLQRGLGVITSSELYRFVHTNSSLLRGNWVVFSDGDVLSGYAISSFMAAVGCNVYTGPKFLPDIDHFSLFVSAGLPAWGFNGDNIMVAHALPAQSKMFIEKPLYFFISPWSMSPSDPLLNRLGIVYFAFDKKPSEVISSQMVPLAGRPVSGLWLYRRK